MGSNPFSVNILGSYSLMVKHITVTCVMWVQVPLTTHKEKEGVAKWLKALVLKTNGQCPSGVRIPPSSIFGP